MLQDFIGQCGIHCRLLVHWGGGWGGWAHVNQNIIWKAQNDRRMHCIHILRQREDCDQLFNM